MGRPGLATAPISSHEMGMAAAPTRLHAAVRELTGGSDGLNLTLHWLAHTRVQAVFPVGFPN